MITVNSNASANISRQALIRSQSNIAVITNRLSTGVRINGAKDDAAGLAISNKLTSHLNGMHQAVSNVGNAMNLLSVAAAGIHSLSDNLQRMREICIQAANDTYDSGNRTALNDEMESLKLNMAGTVQSTTWNNIKLIDGTFKDKNIQVGPNPSDTLTISLSGMGLVDLGIIKPSLTGSTEKAEIIMPPLERGQSITVDGLKFTANQSLTAEQVALSMSALAPPGNGGSNTDLGSYEGSLTRYLLGPADGRKIIATSVVAGENVPDIMISVDGTKAADLPVEVSTDGRSSAPLTPAVSTVEFTGLQAYQSVRVGGLRFMALRDLTPEEVAKNFSNIKFDDSNLSSTDGTYYRYGIEWDCVTGPASGNSVRIVKTYAPLGRTTAEAFGVSPPAPPSVKTTQGEPYVAPVLAKTSIKFSPLAAGAFVSSGNLHFTAARDLTAAEVASAFSGVQDGAITGPGTAYGTYSGKHIFWNYEQAVGDTIISNSTQARPITNGVWYSVGIPATNVTYSPATLIQAGVSPEGATETSAFNFGNSSSTRLFAGQSLTIGGLTFTANKNLRGDEVASAFSGVAPGASIGPADSSIGVYSGKFTEGFTTSSVKMVPYIVNGNSNSYATVEAISTTAYTNVADISFSAGTAISPPQIPKISFQPGEAAILGLTETSELRFLDMEIGQSISLGGLTFTAKRKLDAAAVASVFSNLKPGQTTFPASDLGFFSGVLTGFKSGPANGSSVTFTSIYSDQNVPNMLIEAGGGCKYSKHGIC